MPSLLARNEEAPTCQENGAASSVPACKVTGPIKKAGHASRDWSRQAFLPRLGEGIKVVRHFLEVNREATDRPLMLAGSPEGNVVDELHVDRRLGAEKLPELGKDFGEAALMKPRCLDDSQLNGTGPLLHDLILLHDVVVVFEQVGEEGAGDVTSVGPDDDCLHASFDGAEKRCRFNRHAVEIMKLINRNQYVRQPPRNAQREVKPTIRSLVFISVQEGLGFDSLHLELICE